MIPSGLPIWHAPIETDGGAARGVTVPVAAFAGELPPGPTATTLHSWAAPTSRFGIATEATSEPTVIIAPLAVPATLRHVIW